MENILKNQRSFSDLSVVECNFSSAKHGGHALKCAWLKFSPNVQYFPFTKRSQEKRYRKAG